MPDAAPSAPVQSLRSPQTVFGLIFSFAVIAAGVGAFLTGDMQMKASVIDTAKAAGLLIIGFYFGSSSSSQTKDAAAPPASLPPVP